MLRTPFSRAEHDVPGAAGAYPRAHHAVRRAVLAYSSPCALNSLVSGVLLWGHPQTPPPLPSVRGAAK